MTEALGSQRSNTLQKHRKDNGPVLRNALEGYSTATGHGIQREEKGM